MTDQSTATALSIIDIYAEQKHLTRDDLVVTMMKTIMPRDKNGNDLASKADLIAFLQIAHTYDLDPWAREIYCIVSRGKVLPYISVDGYAKIVNRQPAYDGCEFDYEQNPDGQFLSVTCSMFRKDRTRPVRVTEFMSECYKPDSDAWKRNPARMLRHRAFIQAARLSFSVAGALDEDNEMIDITPVPPPAIDKPAAPKAPPAKKTPPAQQQQGTTDEGEGFRPFAPEENTQQEAAQTQQEAPAAQKKAPPATKKAPPAAANQQAAPAKQETTKAAHDRPDTETLVNDIYDRLGEAQGSAQLLEIWAEINPAGVLEHLDKPEMERWVNYLQKRFDKLDQKFKGAK
jgi:hypothetical protein